MREESDASSNGTPTGVLIDGAEFSACKDPSPTPRALIALKSPSVVVAVGLPQSQTLALTSMTSRCLTLHNTGDLFARGGHGESHEANFKAMSLRKGWRTDRLIAQSFKFYMDGALGSRGQRFLAL